MFFVNNKIIMLILIDEWFIMYLTNILLLIMLYIIYIFNNDLNK